MALAPVVRGDDVVGYSVLKGQFFNQTAAETLRLDPDFGFSILASVDLTDFDRLESATLRLPEGGSLEMDDQGDYWSLLDSFGTKAELDDEYVWGDYLLLFDTVSEGNYSCLVELPESPLPPTPRLDNFGVSMAVDPARALTLNWDFDGVPAKDDFVQVYVNLGHGEVFATPNFGEAGALRSTDRSVTIPADTLIGGFIHELNIEVTRIVSTNLECHPRAEGVGALFRSTSVDLLVLNAPFVRRASRPAGGGMAVEVVADPDQPVVLQGSLDFTAWSDIATNAAQSGTNVFQVPVNPDVPRRFFRAVSR